MTNKIKMHSNYNLFYYEILVPKGLLADSLMIRLINYITTRGLKNQDFDNLTCLYSENKNYSKMIFYKCLRHFTENVNTFFTVPKSKIKCIGWMYTIQITV